MPAVCQNMEGGRRVKKGREGAFLGVWGCKTGPLTPYLNHLPMPWKLGRGLFPGHVDYC